MAPVEPKVAARRVCSMVKRLVLRRYQNPVLCETFSGQHFLASPNDSLQCEVGLTGDWEGAIYRAVTGLIPLGGTVLDVGCHVGYSALLFGNAVGTSGHVYSFEPVSELADKARANVAINHYGDRIEIVPAAVSDRKGTLTIHVSTSMNTGMSSLVRRSRTQAKVQVPTVSLDAWCDERGIALVDVVKIDIEGAEALALKGMDAGLRQSRYRALMIELHPEALNSLGSSTVDVVQNLTSRGYNVAYWSQDERFVNEPLPKAIYILATAESTSSHSIPNEEPLATETI